MESKTLQAAVDALPSGAPVQVAIGAGDQRWDGWIPTGKAELDLTADTGWGVFDARPADGFLCEHVLEHLTLAEAEGAARRVYRALRPGGRFRVAVPDGHVADPAYQALVQVGGPGPADHPAADHKVLYTLVTLTEVLEKAGFRVDPLEYCDPEGRFHFHHWVWEQGPIYRSLLPDHRNGRQGLGFTSLIVDAYRP